MTAGLSSVHLSTRSCEPRHYRDVLCEVAEQRVERVRRCRDFAGEKFEWSPGGNFVRLRGRRHTTPPADVNQRGLIMGFTHQAQRRLMEFVNSIDRSQLNVRRMGFVTLTYPGVWPSDPREWKRHLNVFHMRVRRAFGPLPIIWKLEAQRRGAPHYHMIVVFPDDLTSDRLSEMRSWLSRVWFQIVDSGDERHLRAGTQLDALRSWEGVSSYASKYLGKTTQFIHPSLVTPDGEPMPIGKFWGVWHKDGWPISYSEAYAPAVVVNRVRRNVRRYIEKKGYRHGRLRRNLPFTVFVPSAIFERFLYEEIINGYGYSNWIRWRERRGRPEPFDPYQEFQDFLSQCAAEDTPPWRN